VVNRGEEGNLTHSQFRQPDEVDGVTLNSYIHVSK